MSAITTITLFRYQTLKDKLWAFQMMNKAHVYLKDVHGLRFYRLMGSGKSGFNPLPNWSVYALIMVWDSEEQVEEYLRSSDLFALYRQHSEDCYTVFLSSIRSKGKWSGINPFESQKTEVRSDDKILVLTRATIKWSYLFKFWKYVPHSQKSLESNTDLIFTMGIGEAPLVQMCTLSLWKNTEALEDFAYKQHGHQKAIAMTRKHDWYKEELFARFAAFRSDGTWYGQDLLNSKNA